ncbi:MAG: ATP-binding cassette domain-containing protein, partial [Clostridia bacterium]|nr:ATP-binding cassette domain-containing protein [Clostridia bacterium]
VEDRDKIGFIGSNGAGKSTLFKIILGQSQYDSGTITFGKDLKIGYMEQFLVKDETASVFDETLKVFDELINIENEINDINLEIEMGS